MEFSISKTLPISCICSIYKQTILKELALSIDSLLVQEYIPDEIVIVVDGSIKKEVRTFLKKLIRNEKDIIKVFFLKENIGLGKALKSGIKECKNPYIARFDSDDINLEKRLKIQYDFLKNNSNISIIGSNIFEFDSSLEKITLKKMPNKGDIKERAYMIRNPLNHPSVMFRKKDIINVGSYRDIKYFEDYELWLRCLKNGLKIDNINESLVAMKRESYFKRRHGLTYALCESKFLLLNLQQNSIKFKFIPIYLIRILVRLVPNRISNLLKILDSKRSNYIKGYSLKDYIYKTTKNTNSLTRKYT